ncbi:MAG: hypothetical protein JNM56_06145 [Planctomycetia bacterium]|nr:hypothetical protein [Planctomycetia bacterium]
MFAAVIHRLAQHPCLRRGLACSLSALALALPACDSTGNFTLGGYTTTPNYDDHIRTVYVPIFENRTFRKDLEFDLTRAVIREIEAKTPFKVVSDCDKADTELIGTIIAGNKLLLNRNQLNEVREAETTLMVSILWRDRRTGEILSGGGPRPGDPLLAPVAQMPAMPGMPSAEVPLVQPPTPPQAVAQPAAGEGVPVEAVPGHPAPGCTPPVPALVSGRATFIPELGGSLTTSYQATINRLAVQIVSMMETPW